MEKRGISFKKRVVYTLLEIFISIIVVIVLSFLLIYFLYGKNIINSVNLKNDLEISQIESKESSADFLKEMKVNYVEFDKEGQVLSKYMADHHLILANEAFTNERTVKDVSGEYIPHINEDQLIVIRIPFIPEFSDIELEDKLPFNTLFNRMVIVFCLIVSIIPIIRLIRQIKNEFLELEKIILGPGDETGKKPQISEIQNSIKSVKAMKKMLIHLIEKEKHQKKDLLYQTSALSHDIKTPLTIIKGNLGMLEYCDSKEEERECIEGLYSGIDTIEDYLDKMIQSSKSSYFPETKSEVTVLSIIENIKKGVRGYRTDILFTVNHNIDDDLKIYCSKINVERAVINILTNAFEYAKTEVILTVDLEDNLTFSIYNDGENIDKDLFDDIGKLFYSGDKGRNNSHYGIGLFFAKTVAEEHGGRLTYENLDAGVEFKLGVKLNS